MKTKNILFVALIVLLAGMGSCKKDHDIPTGKVFNANDLDANDFEIVGTWGVEKIDYYDIDNAGNPIASTLQSHEYDPNDIDNGIQMVFREDNTGELYDKTSVDSTKVNPFAYTYVNDTLFLEIDYGTDTSTYSCIIVEKTNDSFIYENEYFLNHVEKAYLKRLSHEPIVLSDGFTVSVSANPANGGTVIGGGTYQGGQTCTVTATANTSYTFTYWTENEALVSTDATYSFTVESDKALVANFVVSSVDGHAFIDLGMPSGLLWAMCNVGADSPEDYGDYFAWGETEPKSVYSWSTYQYCNGSSSTLTKYCYNSDYGYNGFTDNLTILLPEDDAATANWGSDWRMPTIGEWQELYQNTTHIWTTQNGVNGRLFTASNGNSLFLPAAGYRYNSSLDDAGSIGYYWSSSLNTDYPSRAWYFGFRSAIFDMYGYDRNYGFTVRPVCSSRQN